MNALDILGLKINFKKWNKEKQLPLFILNDFLVQQAIINDLEYLSLTPPRETYQLYQHSRGK